MAVTVGTRLGAYEVIGALGGGMGEVYRARDTRLERDVAIKILPPLFAADPDAAARGPRHREADVARARGRARARDRPSRSETRQRQASRGRLDQDSRFRARQGDGARDRTRRGRHAGQQSHDDQSCYDVPLSGDGSPVSIFGEPGLLAFRLSPDGAWVAYVSSASGTDEIYARPAHGSGMRLTLSTGGGSEPVWRRDGRGVYFRQGDNFVLASLDLGASPRVINRETILSGDFARRGRWSYDVMPGDGRLLVQDPVPGAIRLVAVQGWMSEFRDRLAAVSRYRARASVRAPGASS